MDKTVDVRIYHLERIANILNTPKMYGIRLEYLEIEMTKEEQFYPKTYSLLLKLLSTCVLLQCHQIQISVLFGSV